MKRILFSINRQRKRWLQNKYTNSEDITFICVDHEQIRLYVETWKDIKFKVQSYL
jgi:6-phosphogluconolactonase (cycloisomerase 2 family)